MALGLLPLLSPGGRPLGSRSPGTHTVVAYFFIKKNFGVGGGVWVAQSVKHPTLAQVTVSRSVCSSPESVSGLTARSLEPVSDSVSPSLSDPPPFMLCFSLSQN